MIMKITLAVPSNYVCIKKIRVWYKAEQGPRKMREIGGQKVVCILIRYL